MSKNTAVFARFNLRPFAPRAQVRPLLIDHHFRRNHAEWSWPSIRCGAGGVNHQGSAPRLQVDLAEHRDDPPAFSWKTKQEHPDLRTDDCRVEAAVSPRSKQSRTCRTRSSTQ
jgi:hypothetical protein